MTDFSRLNSLNAFGNQNTYCIFNLKEVSKGNFNNGNCKNVSSVLSLTKIEILMPFRMHFLSMKYKTYKLLSNVPDPGVINYFTLK